MRATLTFSQPNLQVSATLEHQWSPPSLPPPTPCAPGGGGFLVAKAVGSGGGADAQVGC